MKKRKEISEIYKWDLTDYCPSNEVCKEEIEKLESGMEELALYEGNLKDEKTVFDCLTKESEYSKHLSRLYVYSSLKVKEDATDSQSVALSEKVGAVCVKMSTLTSFVDVEISALSDELLEKMMNNKKYPQYKNYFKNILRNRPHMLSKKEEKLLSQVGDFADGFSNVFDMLDNADMRFEDVLDSSGNKHKLTHASYSLLVQSDDRKLRENAFREMNGRYGKFNNTIAINYINEVKSNCFFSKVRKFNSCLEASIFAEEASEKVYEALIDGVNQRLSVFHKYFEIKRKELGLDNFAIFDMYALTNSDFDIKVRYEEAIELVKKATAPLGEEYVSLVERAKSERWIDVFENEGKDSGAFSWGAYGCHPVVRTNYVPNSESVFTLAHELGHCMHTYFSNKNQPYEMAGYTIFVAEVASNVNEMMLLLYLLKRAKSSKEKIFYFDHLLSMFRGSVFRQTMFAEFEQFAHEKYEKTQTLSKDILNEYYLELNKKYFGEKVIVPEEIKFEWSRIPHFYNSFYVYKYATGLISAMVIAQNIFNEKPNAKENYFKFLSSGDSLPPVELLKIAGVDLENPETIVSAFDFIDDILDEWQKLQ